MNYWNIHFVFNFIEGIWWMGLGFSIFYFQFSNSPKHSQKMALCISLILFGISDFVEMATGAWWRPWWLLVWKGLCVGIGLILFILIYRERSSL